MNCFKLYQDLAKFVEKETEIAVKVAMDAYSTSTTLLNTIAASNAEMYRHAKSLHKSRQDFMKSFSPYFISERF